MVKIMFERLTVKQKQRVTGSNNSANNDTSKDDIKIIDFEENPTGVPIITSNAQCIVVIQPPS